MNKVVCDLFILFALTGPVGFLLGVTIGPCFCKPFIYEARLPFKEPDRSLCHR